MLTKGEEKIIVQEEPKQPVIETRQVVVAKMNIPVRTRIKEEMLQMKEVPVELITGDPISSFDEVRDVQAKFPIFAGDVLTKQKFSEDKTFEGFVGAIPPECRAVSINVNEITSVAGFAKPGDRVDLLLVEKSNYSATTDIILQNVQLLSVNQDMGDASIIDEASGSTSAINNPTIATFALPPEDVLKLISASKLGEIYMMLRPKNPKAVYVAKDEGGYTFDSVNKPKPAPEPTPVIPATPVPDVPLPQIPIPEVPIVPVTPKFDIIQGDELTQSSEETSKVQSSSAPASSSGSALPAIPSRNANQGFTAPPVPDVPLSSSPIMNQIGH